MSVNKASKMLGVSCGGLSDTLNSPKWAERYARAREQRAATLAERAVDTIEDSTLDPADKRVRLDGYKWFAARLDPKRWSEKQQVEHTGADGGPLVVTWRSKDSS